MRVINPFIFILLSIYIVPCFASVNEQASVDHKYSLNNYTRKLLKVTNQGLYLVQDFYGTGEKLTDPFLLKNNDNLVIFNLSNKDYMHEDEYDHIDIVGDLVTWYSTGQKRSERKGNSSTGSFLSWYKNGQKEKEANYNNGELDGLYQLWYENGLKKEEILYSKGNVITAIKWDKEGEKTYEEKNDIKKGSKEILSYTKGKKKSEFKYYNSSHDGHSILFDKEGAKIVEYTYVKGRLKDTIYYNYIRKLLSATPQGYLVQDFYKNGNKKTEPFMLKKKSDIEKIADYDELSIEGTLIRWNEEGKKFLLTYHDGEKNGEIGVWYQDGTQMDSDYMINNQQDGLSQSWYKNGVKRIEGNFKKGDKEGKWLYWYENGQKKSEENYVHDKLNGQYYEWYENGQIKKERYYKNGELIDKNIAWYPNGQELLKATYKKDSLEKLDMWSVNKSYHVKIFYKRGLSYKSQLWWEDKKLIENHFHDGLYDGLSTRWYKNGQIAEKGQYKKGEKQGLWEYWYKNGQQKMQGGFSQDKQQGTWTYWDKEGNGLEKVIY